MKIQCVVSTGPTPDDPIAKQFNGYLLGICDDFQYAIVATDYQIEEEYKEGDEQYTLSVVRIHNVSFKEEYLK